MTTTSYRERIAEARESTSAICSCIRKPCLFFAVNAFKTFRLKSDTDTGCKQVVTRRKNPPLYPRRNFHPTFDLNISFNTIVKHCEAYQLLVV